jgi:hypothetical protein
MLWSVLAIATVISSFPSLLSLKNSKPSTRCRSQVRVVFWTLSKLRCVC